MSKAEEAAGRTARSTQAAPQWEAWEELDADSKARWIKFAMSIVAAHDAEREPCRWTGKDVGDRFLVWTASCRSPVNLAPGFLPGSDGCRYCHGCGKPIEVTL